MRRVLNHRGVTILRTNPRCRVRDPMDEMLAYSAPMETLGDCATSPRFDLGSRMRSDTILCWHLIVARIGASGAGGMA